MCIVCHSIAIQCQSHNSNNSIPIIIYSVTINDVVKSLALKKSVVEVTNDSSLVSMILTLETSYPE